MVWIKVIETARGRDVDLPETVKHRSIVGGTLILTPGASREVTDEEWEHIKQAHPDLLAGIQVLGDAKPGS